VPDAILITGGRGVPQRLLPEGVQHVRDMRHLIGRSRPQIGCAPRMRGVDRLPHDGQDGALGVRRPTVHSRERHRMTGRRRLPGGAHRGVPGSSPGFADRPGTRRRPLLRSVDVRFPPRATGIVATNRCCPARSFMPLVPSRTRADARPAGRAPCRSAARHGPTSSSSPPSARARADALGGESTRACTRSTSSTTGSGRTPRGRRRRVVREDRARRFALAHVAKPVPRS
jgi:hypothetical protein